MRTLIASLCLIVTACLRAQTADLAHWPASADPVAVGNRLSEHFLATDHWIGTGKNHYIIYPEVCTWFGALKFAANTGNVALRERLIDRFAPLFQPENVWMVPPSNHVDASVFGAVPLEIYRQTGRLPYRTLGLAMADAQWDNPTADGLTDQTRFWIDDMFMVTAVQVQAFRATGHTVYLDRASREMIAYLDKLQRPNGLFYHAPDVPFYWGRGNGWVAVGMTELLLSLPADHPARPRILASYHLMMETLLANQAPEGLWRQLIDRPESWIETSSSAMFTYAMINGVRHGWLDAARYAPAVRKAWINLVTYLDEHDNLREVCVGTNKKNDYQYYIDRPRSVGDLHGQAPVLWCAEALLAPETPVSRVAAP
jgi:unsaturated rhamnogalacturonyl hydrolase